jgi:hypothetical protein
VSWPGLEPVTSRMQVRNITAISRVDFTATNQLKLKILRELIYSCSLRSKIFAAVNIWIAFFLIVTLCGLEVYQRFILTCVSIFTLKIYTADFFETLVICYYTVTCHNLARCCCIGPNDDSKFPPDNLHRCVVKLNTLHWLNIVTC